MNAMIASARTKLPILCKRSLRMERPRKQRQIETIRSLNQIGLSPKEKIGTTICGGIRLKSFARDGATTRCDDQPTKTDESSQTTRAWRRFRINTEA